MKDALNAEGENVVSEGFKLYAESNKEAISKLGPLNAGNRQAEQPQQKKK